MACELSPTRQLHLSRAGKDNIGVIAGKLQVRNVLEGSVRRYGDKLKVKVPLADAESGYYIWSQRYERTLEDVFAIQEEIASSVVGLIREDSTARLFSLKSRYRGSAGARLHYLQGRYYLAAPRHQFSKS